MIGGPDDSVHFEALQQSSRQPNDNHGCCTMCSCAAAAVYLLAKLLHSQIDAFQCLMTLGHRQTISNPNRVPYELLPPISDASRCSIDIFRSVQFHE